MTPAWYAVYTAPQQEDRVYRALMLGNSLPVYLPKRISWATHARRRQQRERPLFPRYLFVRVSSLAHFAIVRTTRGVQDFVRAGDRPFPIHGDQINRLMDLETTGAFDETRERPKTRREKLRPVLEGKLGDLKARIDAAAEDTAILVLLAEAGIVDARRTREAA